MQSIHANHNVQDSRARRCGRSRDDRRGAVLVVVLVAIVLLSLAAYSFTDAMVSEMAATSMFERQAKARLLAESGVEWIAAVVGRRYTEPQNLYQNAALFSGVMLVDAEEDIDRGRFTVFTSDLRQPELGLTRFGIVDESSKLNLNTLLEGDQDEEELRDRLMLLPEMTIEIADALLDWIDDDEEPRQFGAENEYYGTLTPPYQTRNAPFESIDELLSVRGITPWHLYGEDGNRNGILDAAENDAEATLPLDDADGVLWQGWHVYLTVESAEANRQADGSPRIYVNGDDLAQLYDDLAAQFDEETATFVVAYRLFGASSSDSTSGSTPAGNNQSGGSAGGGRGGSGGAAGGRGGSGGSGGSSGPSGGSGGGSSAGSGGGSSSSSGSNETRGGMELGSGSNSINSLFDLIDIEIEATVNMQDKTLTSPWSTKGGSLESSLPALLDGLTTTEDLQIPGRVNINLAPREVLLMVPGIDSNLADAIVGRQQPEAVPATAGVNLDSTIGWLLVDNLVDLETMQTLAPYVTARGDVYRAQVVGHFDAGPTACRVEVVLDATSLWPQVISFRDLTELGGIPTLTPQIPLAP